MRVLQALVTAMLCCLVVVGCSDGETVRPAPLPTESETVAPTPGNRPPILDPVGDTHTPAGIENVARYFIDTITFAIQTGDTSLLRQASTRECKSCRAIANNIEEIYESGGSIETAGWELQSYRLLGFDQADETAVSSLNVIQLPALTTHRPGAEPTPSKRVSRTFTLHLSQVRIGWVVAQFDLVSSK
ncbi:MAG TPA: DUF6318 family protein [Nocardioidaceae bacterium]|nr:DUF6318 family protein [Nocardioidaceae bacterium]